MQNGYLRQDAGMDISKLSVWLNLWGHWVANPSKQKVFLDVFEPLRMSQEYTINCR